MKFLILGCNGMAGHMIARYLTEKGHRVTGFAKEEGAVCPAIVGDACDGAGVAAALNSDEYDVVVNCIGILNQAVDKKPSMGIYLNSVFPHFVAEQLAGRSCKLIHISTDCVFDGARGGYTEQDRPDEISMYGKSKAMGEVTYGRNLTFRTSIIGPELNPQGVGLFHWFMTQPGPVTGFSGTIWTGVTTLQLAKAVETAAGTEISGLYHLVNNEQISKYELLLLFNRFCRNPRIPVEKDDRIVSQKTLINTRRDFDFEIPSYEIMVKEMGEWIRAHGEIYGQYRQEERNNG